MHFLYFPSDNSEILVSRIRAFMSHFIFRTNAPKNLVTDHHQPLFIPFGKDSFSGIGNPPLSESMVDTVGPRYNTVVLQQFYLDLKYVQLLTLAKEKNSFGSF